MTSRRVPLFAAASLAAALVMLMCTALPASHAEEKPAKEQVQQLLPRLRSADASVRARAESELFALGESGRLEMERLARSKDATESSVALRLMQSDRWAAKPRGGAKTPLPRTGVDADDADAASELRAEIERRFEAARKRIEEALHGVDAPKLELPELEIPEINWSELELPRITLGGVPSGSVSVSGVVSRDGRTLHWSRDAAGKTSVTVTERDAESHAYEAESVAAFRAAHPDVAEMLDEMLPSWTGGPTLRIFSGLPEINIHQDPSAAVPGTGTPRLPAPVPVLGIGFDAPSALLCHHLGIESGVVVTRVLRDSQAAELGLQPMDIVLALSGRPISSSASIRTALREIGDGALTAEIIRSGERRTLGDD